MKGITGIVPERLYSVRALLSKRMWVLLFKRVVSANLQDRATVMAFYLLFSLFPTLLMLATIADLLWTPRDFFAVADPFLRALPTAARDTVRYFVSDLLSGAGGTTLFSFSTVGLLWSVSAYFRATVGNVGELAASNCPRPFWSTLWLSLRLSVISILVTFVLTVVVLGPFVVEWLASHVVYFQSLASDLWKTLQWPLICLTMLLSLDYVYYVAPAHRAKWRWITVGSVVATCLCVLASLGLAYYAAGFGNYQKVYGALGGVILLLLWAWLINMAILFGAVVNTAVSEVVEWLVTNDQIRHTAEEDTTVRTS